MGNPPWHFEGFEWEKFTTPQAIPSGAGGTGTIITNWESTPNIDSDGSLADGFNPVTGVFTPAANGWYIMSFQLQFAAGVTGWREAQISIVHARVRGMNVGGSDLWIAGSAGITELDGPGGPRFFTADLRAKHTQGADLNVTYAAFHVVRLA